MVLWEVTAFPPQSEPTRSQQSAAKELIEACYRAALDNGWFDFQKGLADGFQLMADDRRHYENRAFILDDRVLDPERPEFLMYYGTPSGKKLAGFMFYTASPLSRGPQIGGSDTIWHFHVWTRPVCMLDGLVSVGASQEGRCAQGEPYHRSPEMIHVWLLDHPEGPFTTAMQIDPPLLNRLLKERAATRPETVVSRQVAAAPPEGPRSPPAAGSSIDSIERPGEAK